MPAFRHWPTSSRPLRGRIAESEPTGQNVRGYHSGRHRGFYARLDVGAGAFSPLRNINRKPSEGFSLVADNNGKVTACWLSGKLYANVSHDSGETFEPIIEIKRQFDPCNCCTTSACYGEDGKLAVLYREETNNERDMYLVLWDQDRGEMTRKSLDRTPWKFDACPMTCYTVNPEVALAPNPSHRKPRNQEETGAIRDAAD